MSMMEGVRLAQWSVAENIVCERPYGPLGLEMRRGTKHFRPGAKVWVIDWFPGMCSNVVVVGQHRGSRQFATMAIRVKFTENWRPRLVYSPTVLALVDKHFGSEPRPVSTEDEAKEMCCALAAWREQFRPKPIHEPGRIVAQLAGDRLRVVPFRDEQMKDSDISRHWDIPATLFPEELARVGAVVLVDRGLDGAVTVLAFKPEPEAS